MSTNSISQIEYLPVTFKGFTENVSDFYSFPKKMPKIRFLTVTNVTPKKGGE
jgi:hypothetical protein